MRFTFLHWGFILWLNKFCHADQTYQPEEYAAACLGVIGASYHWGGSTCDGLGRKNKTACQCGLPEFLETVVSCVDQLIESTAQNQNWSVSLESYNSVVTQCRPKRLSVGELTSFHANSSRLEPYTGSKQIEEFGKCNATHAFKPTLWESTNALQAYKMNSLTPPRAHRAGGGVLAYWGGVMLIRFIVHWTSVMIPSSRHLANNSLTRILRRSVTIPPTFSRKHSQSQYVTRYFPLHIPTREQTLIILGFIAVHLGLSFGMLPIHRPSYLYKYNDHWLYCREMGYRSGKLVVFEVPLLILFAGRNNFLQWLTGWSHDTFVVFHKWIARCVAFSLLVHAAGHTVDKLSSGSYFRLWSVAYWNYGIAGGVFGGFLVFQAMYAFRRLSYEIFLVLHILLAVGFVVAGYYHLKLQEGELQYFYAMWAVWGFDRAMRVARILISGPQSKAELQLHEGNVVEYTIEYSNLWTPRPGDYAFVHIAHWSSFWQSHPFTLSRGVLPGEENKLKMFTRVKNGLTKRLMNRVLNHGGNLVTNVWVDGPYGPSYNVKEFDEALFLTGGIGITAPFSYIQGILSDPKSKTTVIKLYWAIGDDTPLEWFKHQIDYLKKSGRVDIFIHKGGSRRVDPRFEQDRCDEDLEKRSTSKDEFAWPNQACNIDEEVVETKTKELSVRSSGSYSLFTHPLDTSAVVRQTMANASGSLAVLSCAPDAINDAARATIANELCSAPNYVEYFEESFSW